MKIIQHTQTPDDVGFPFVCCEYHWLIKELSWSCGRVKEQSQGGKTKLNAEIKEVESGGSHGADTGDRHAETFLVGYDLMVTHKLMQIS